MSVARHDRRTQICCDSCPAAYPNTYAAEDFAVMVADAKAAGWLIAKVGPRKPGAGTADLFGAPPRIAGKPEQLYTHTCPDCRRSPEPERML
jgi:hypothetical protein